MPALPSGSPKAGVGGLPLAPDPNNIRTGIWSHAGSLPPSPGTGTLARQTVLNRGGNRDEPLGCPKVEKEPEKYLWVAWP